MVWFERIKRPHTWADELKDSQYVDTKSGWLYDGIEYDTPDDADAVRLKTD